jgi:hypoxia up-regulated 1
LCTGLKIPFTYLGFPSDALVITYHIQIASADIAESARKTIDLVQAERTKRAVEELMAMKFAYIKHLAKLVANEKVTDVPPYYSQFERDAIADAIADAIEIACLRTLTIINNGTAVAVNYAMTRAFPTPGYHAIYDAGSLSIRATVALAVLKELNSEREIAKEQKRAGVCCFRRSGQGQI